MAQPTPRVRADAEVEFARVVTFSDGVFAIAMTLLVLGLEIPSGVDDLGEALADESGSLLAYLLSFAVLGKLWLDHHAYYAGLDRFDTRLMALNLVYLAWVAVVPFTSQLLGDYGADSIAVAVYAANITGLTVSLAIQVAYAYRRRLIADDMREVARREWGPGGWAAAVVFLVSIPLALASPLAAMLIWLLALPVGDRLGEPFAKRALGH